MTMSNDKSQPADASPPPNESGAVAKIRAKLDSMITTYLVLTVDPGNQEVSAMIGKVDAENAVIQGMKEFIDSLPPPDAKPEQGGGVNDDLIRRSDAIARIRAGINLRKDAAEQVDSRGPLAMAYAVCLEIIDENAAIASAEQSAAPLAPDAASVVGKIRDLVVDADRRCQSEALNHHYRDGASRMVREINVVLDSLASASSSTPEVGQ